ncbi:MAG: hypothetical protein ABI867_40685 [Kofleriaceae bacterium]
MRYLVPMVLVVGCGDGGDAAVDARPDGFNVPRSTVFLAFDGLSVQPGNADDASSDTSQIATETLTVQSFLSGDPDRAARTLEVVSEMETLLAPFNIEITTTRPAGDAYDMIVFGESAEPFGLPRAVPGLAFPVDCADANPHNVTFVFSGAFGPAATGGVFASMAIPALAVVNGIPSANRQGDCLCWNGAECDPIATCTIGGPGTPIAANQPCAGGETTMDPRARLRAAFGDAP